MPSPRSVNRNGGAPEMGAELQEYRIPCVLMRGGTSKGVFFAEADLPEAREDRDAVLLAAMGSPDPRQIDGLGGADPLTSKVCIIGPGDAHGADCTYTFAQIGIDQPYVALAGNCGNLSAAVGVYAIEEGLARPTDPVTTVRVHNTNTGQPLLIHVPTRNGRPFIDGDFAIAGVPGTGAEIRLDYSATAGATTGRILPTGSAVDNLYVPELGRYLDISIVDFGKATCYFRAEEIGLIGNEGPEAFTAEVLAKFWAIRNAAANAIGLAPDSRLPTPVAVAPRRDSIDFTTGKSVSADQMSFLARRVLGPPPRLHKAFASTGAVCTAVAARLSGTVVQNVCAKVEDNTIRIGHPSGVFPVCVAQGQDGSFTEVSYSRTARRLMEGQAVLRLSRLLEAKKTKLN